MQSILFDLKRPGISDYQPIKISTQAMSFLLEYSNEIPCNFHSDLHGLIAMDMGDEFILPKDECIQTIDKLLTFKLSGKNEEVAFERNLPM